MSPFSKTKLRTLRCWRLNPWLHTRKARTLSLNYKSSFHFFTSVFMPIQPHRKNGQICPGCLHTTHKVYRHTPATLLRNSWQEFGMDSYGKRKVVLSFTESYLFKKKSIRACKTGESRPTDLQVLVLF